MEQKKLLKKSKNEDNNLYRTPSSRRKSKQDAKLNLTPILDAVFIFIFFLLMSASFTKIYEIASDVPMISNKKPPKSKKKPLALTVRIKKSRIDIFTGVPSSLLKRIPNLEGKYDTQGLHDYLIGLKTKFVSEDTSIIEPIVDINYEELVKIMDSVRLIHPTDDSIYKKDKDGMDVKVENLFSNIVFGNIQS